MFYAPEVVKHAEKAPDLWGSVGNSLWMTLRQADVKHPDPRQQRPRNRWQNDPPREVGASSSPVGRIYTDFQKAVSPFWHTNSWSTGLIPTVHCTNRYCLHRRRRTCILYHNDFQIFLLRNSIIALPSLPTQSEGIFLSPQQGRNLTNQNAESGTPV